MAKGFGPKTNTGRISSDQVMTRLRSQKALAMRMRGVSLSVIAARLGYGNSGNAKNAISREIERLPAEDAAQWRHIENMRLDKMLAGIWKQATTGDLPAIDRVLKIMERRARMMGLDEGSTDKDYRQLMMGVEWQIPLQDGQTARIGATVHMRDNGFSTHDPNESDVLPGEQEEEKTSHPSKRELNGVGSYSVQDSGP